MSTPQSRQEFYDALVAVHRFNNSKRLWSYYSDRVGVSLTPQSIAVLRFVSARVATRPSEIADVLGAPRSAVSRRLRQLEQLRLVCRSPDDADRRGFLVQVTQMGQDVLRAFEIAKDDLLKRQLGDIDSDRLETVATELLSALDRLWTGLEEAEATSGD